MNNQLFLQQALEKSFLQPILKNFNNIDFAFCQDSSGNFVIADKSTCQLSPYIIFHHQIKEYIQAAHYDIKHSSSLNKEYKQFKHYFEENIIIPEQTPKVQSLRLWLGLTSVSRQSAQKKCVISTIMPPNFKENLLDLEINYRKSLEKIQVCKEENLNEVEITLVEDFVKTYSQIIKHFHYSDILLFYNKIYLHKYLCIALEQITKFGDISIDFEIKHNFIGHKSRYLKKYSERYRNSMIKLISLIKIMSNNSSLLNLINLFLNNKKEFNQSFKDFCNQRHSPNLDDIIAIKDAAQTMFNEFAKLCYLEGVRNALETKYLEECPSPQNPPLTTLSPEEEMGKIRNIVEESYHIDYHKTQIGKIYDKALEQYNIAKEQIDKTLINYIGITNSDFDNNKITSFYTKSIDKSRKTC